MRAHIRRLQRVVESQPVMNKLEFAVGFVLVAEAILCLRGGRLEEDHLPSLAVQAVTRAEIAVKLEGRRQVVELLQIEGEGAGAAINVTCLRGAGLQLKLNILDGFGIGLG